MIGSALFLAILDLAVVVDGKGSCPAPAAVARELEELMPTGGEPREPDIADISREGADLHLELRRGDGSWVAVRNIPGGRGCEDLAKAVAVVIAAWEAELASGVTETVSLPPPPPVRRRSRRFGSALLAMATPNQSARATPAVVSPPADPARAAHPRTEFSVGLGGMLGGGDLATGVVIDTFARQAEGPLALRVGVELTTPHRNELDANQRTFEWRRFAFDTGVGYRATTEDLFVDLHTSLKMAALHIDLLGPATTVSTTVADFGLGTGVRLGFGTPGRRRVLPWVGFDLTVWSRHAMVATATSSETLPSVDVGFCVGFLGGP